MAKGQPLTDEQKQKMAEGRKRAAAQKKAEAEAAEVQETQDANVMATAHEAETVPAPLTSAPDFVSEGISEWGPYPTQQDVHTPYGLYGLDANTIMHFRGAKEWSAKEQKEIDTMKPVYRKVVTA